MRLHYNSEAASVATVRKLKSVVLATQAKVEEVTYKTGDDVSKVSFFNTLPLLETPQGTFFSSNTILRYFASAFKKTLYGGDSVFTQSLVDQWLDIITCEFEPAVRGISRHQQGQKIDFGKLMEDVNKFLSFIEKHFADKKFLVGDSLTIADLSLVSNLSVVFGVMLGQGQRKKNPNVLNFYNSIVNLNKEVGPADLPKEAHQAFRGGKKGGKQEKPKQAKQEAKQEAKKQTKPQKTAQDDLFGSDNEPEAPKAPVAPKPKKEQKKKAAAKSIVVFDVKTYDQTTDLIKIFEKIKQIKVDGLVWNSEPKLIPVAFGMNKLQVACVVEDEKVSLQDLYEKIEEWQEVQSTDTVSFQKL